MSSVAWAPSRALLEALSPIRSRPTCGCARLPKPRRQTAIQHGRKVSTATPQRSEMEVENTQRPRWSYTPPAMAAPYPIKSRPSNWQPFKCNSDPQVLDDMYFKFLGPRGPRMLSEETKWLAVTHKSFDHGRRGFNDRLAFLGKRILELQTSLGLLIRPHKHLKETLIDPHGREPFEHPATDNVESLLGNRKSYLMYHMTIARLAEEFSIPSIVRWQPKNPDNLSGSGSEMVYAQAVFAIIGALAMEQGGAVANKVARERVILYLGRQRKVPDASDESESPPDM